MAPSLITEAALHAALAGFQDPETGRSITQLNQVHQLHLEDGRASITLGLTTWAAPLWEESGVELAESLKNRFPGLQVTVAVAEHRQPPEKMGQVGLAVKSLIVVGSGKGGVGKSRRRAAGCRAGPRRLQGRTAGRRRLWAQRAAFAGRQRAAGGDR